MTPTERETLIDLLQSFRLSYTVEPDDETGLSLLDRLTPDGDNDVSRGKDEIQFLAEEIELFFKAEHDKARNQAIQDCIDKLIEGGWSGDLDHNVRKLFVDLESLKTNQT